MLHSIHLRGTSGTLPLLLHLPDCFFMHPLCCQMHALQPLIAQHCIVDGTSQHHNSHNFVCTAVQRSATHCDRPQTLLFFSFRCEAVAQHKTSRGSKTSDNPLDPSNHSSAANTAMASANSMRGVQCHIQCQPESLRLAFNTHAPAGSSLGDEG